MRQGADHVTGIPPDTGAAYPPSEVARRFVTARRAARALSDFPGTVPADMAAGYLIQEAAIELWPDEIAGWKVGRIPAELQASLAAERVMGPVFRANVSQATGAPTPVFAIAGGFAAVEAEYIYRMGEDAPAGKTDWTPEAALELVEEELVGVEFAGSPLASINILPTPRCSRRFRQQRRPDPRPRHPGLEIPHRRLASLRGVRRGQAGRPGRAVVAAGRPGCVAGLPAERHRRARPAAEARPAGDHRRGQRHPRYRGRTNGPHHLRRPGRNPLHRADGPAGRRRPGRIRPWRA